MLNSVYKLGNFFNIGNSFLLCCKMSSFNYSIIKRKLDHYNIISKMKNSLEKFPVIKEYQKKKNNKDYHVYIRGGIYFSFSIYMSYKTFKFLKKYYIANSFENRIIKYFYDNPKMIDLLLEKFDKLCEDDNFRKKIYKKVNSYIKKNYEFFKKYVNPFIINKIKDIINTENAQIMFIEVFKKTIINNKMIQNKIIDYIYSNFNNLNINKETIYLNYIENLLVKIFENKEIKEMFYTEFFNILNQKLLEKEVIKSTSEFIEKNIQV